MAFLNEQTNELHLKILYAGPLGSGKTTNIQSIFKQTSPSVATRFFDLHGIGKSNHFFDFLPISYGEARSHALRLHLFSLPAHTLWETVLLNLLWGIDGIVCVLDSRIEFLHNNEIYLAHLKKLLQLTGRSFADIPLMFQFNHRDSPTALNIKALRTAFSRFNTYDIEAVAVQDIGVMESLDIISEKILHSMESPPTAMDKASLGFL